MRFYLRVLCVALAVVCAYAQSPGQAGTQFEFGKLLAQVNGKDFAGVFGSYSVIAVWDTSVGQLQIQGDKRQTGQRTESVRVTMRCGAMPKPGTYAIKSPLTPVSSDAFIAGTGWERVWPLRGNGNRPFISDSMPAGKLVLERVDSIIKGRFDVSLRSFNRVPAETLYVRGTFFGRLSIHPDFAQPRERWAPMFQTDCERIRNAVSM